MGNPGGSSAISAPWKSVGFRRCVLLGGDLNRSEVARRSHVGCQNVCRWVREHAKWQPAALATVLTVRGSLRRNACSGRAWPGPLEAYSPATGITKAADVLWSILTTKGCWPAATSWDSTIVIACAPGWSAAGSTEPSGW